MTTTTRGWEAATRSKRLTLAWWSARIDCNSFDDARGSCGREHRLLFVEERGSIGFDPDQRGGKRQAIGAGIETGSEVQHCIGVNGLNAVEDQLVEDLRADCERPGEPARSRVRPGHGRHPFGDPPPALPCQSSREGDRRTRRRSARRSAHCGAGILGSGGESTGRSGSRCAGGLGSSFSTHWTPPLNPATDPQT